MVAYPAARLHVRQVRVTLDKGMPQDQDPGVVAGRGTVISWLCSDMLFPVWMVSPPGGLGRGTLPGQGPPDSPCRG